jgi:hypothetical protein
VKEKNRQIRRMFHAIGSGVMKLHRCQVGNINLNSMIDNGGMEGCWRILDDDEVYNGLGWEVRDIGLQVGGKVTGKRGVENQNKYSNKESKRKTTSRKSGNNKFKRRR